MADSTERIVVDVVGEGATSGFGRIRTSAKEADEAIDKLGATVDSAQQKINSLGTAGQQAATGLEKAGEGGKEAGKGVDEAEKSATKAILTFDNLRKSMFGIKGASVWLWDMAVGGFEKAIGFAETFIEKISAVQRTMSLLNMMPNSDVGQEFEYLMGIVKKYGASLEQLQTNYARFMLSGQNSSMTTDAMKRSFEQIAIAVRTLHMNTQQAQFTFLALEEMMSKGQVSMQQMNRQFAIRIPGAMDAIAREIGITTPMLVEFITKVGAASDKMMPFITNALQRLTQGGVVNAAQALDAEFNRLSSSLIIFYKNVLDAGGDKGMGQLLRTMTAMFSQSDIAKVFADTMNTITLRIDAFLKSLKPEDIDRFAKTILQFFSDFATLAILAAQAAMFLSRHIVLVATALGGFMGASLGARFGPWGAAVGLVLGAAGANITASSAVAGAEMPSTKQDLQAEYAGVKADIIAVQKKIDDSGWLNKHLGPTGLTTQKHELEIQEKKLKAQIDAFPSATSAAADSLGPAVPKLEPVADMIKGSHDQIMKYLEAALGSKTHKHKKTPEETLAERQKNFVEGLEATVRAFENPEEQEYDKLRTKMESSTGLKLTSGPLFDRGEIALGKMQDQYNKVKQAALDEKTRKAKSQAQGMEDQTKDDTGKFLEKYDITNLKQVDDQAWATQARKMGTQLNKELIEQQKKRESDARLNPYYAAEHPDIAGEIAVLRAQGNAYIEEFKRIEAEKRTVMGGTKTFLTEWNESANNFGQITNDFLKGVSSNIVDMLTTMVTTGRLSFATLTQFVLNYLAKMMIVQSVTPFMNNAAPMLSKGLGMLLGLGASVSPSSYYSPTDTVHMATGGATVAGESYTIGEHGPEIMTFDRPGYITPNESVRSSSSNNVAIQINVDSSGTKTSGDASYAGLGRRISDAVKAVLVNEKRPGGMLA